MRKLCGNYARLALSSIVAMGAVLLPFSCVETPNAGNQPNYGVLNDVAFVGNIANELSKSSELSQIKTADQLEALVLSAVSRETGNNVTADYTSFKYASGFGALKNFVRETYPATARIATTGDLNLADVCSKVSAKLLKDKNISSRVGDYIDQFSKRIGSIGDKYLKELEKDVVEIDGKKYIPNDKFNRSDYVDTIKKDVAKMESQIDGDKKLSSDERRMLVAYTASIKVNIDGLDAFFARFFKLSSPNGRLGFWTAIRAVFQSVGAAITTVLCTAVGTLVGFVLGGPWGAVAGFTIGALVGYGFSCEYFLYLEGPVQCDDCASFLQNGLCDQCKSIYPFYVAWNCN